MWHISYEYTLLQVYKYSLFSERKFDYRWYLELKKSSVNVISSLYKKIQIENQILFSDLQPIVRKNKMREKSNETFAYVTGASDSLSDHSKADQMDHIVDIREFDVPYHVRVSIDRKINVVRECEQWDETTDFVPVDFETYDFMIFNVELRCERMPGEMYY